MGKSAGAPLPNNTLYFRILAIKKSPTGNILTPASDTHGKFRSWTLPKFAPPHSQMYPDEVERAKSHLNDHQDVY